MASSSVSPKSFLNNLITSASTSLWRNWQIILRMIFLTVSLQCRVEHLLSSEKVVVVGLLVGEKARLETKLVDEMVSEAVVVGQPHRAKLSLPAFLQVSE